eukprot:TRINITY_DN4788_c0_g3_i4.p1 TRINITY_DN4788_c0_g3~~TRINITY_DN4788_c0_g3_i4.p1  ORF type:complete len:973 (+),score=385.78 TRINITY_DN4788_c0_g3_i4:76-2994(+)
MCIRDRYDSLQKEHYRRGLEDSLRSPYISRSVRTSLELQQKMLNLASFQRELREKLLSKTAAVDPLYGAMSEQLVNRRCYLRPKPVSDKAEKLLEEKYEKRIRVWQSEVRNSKQRKFLEELAVHYKEFTEFHKKKQLALKKRAMGAKAFLWNIKRQEDKGDMERLKVLEAGEMDKYLEMVNSAKNSRMLEILMQTNKFLEQLGAKIEKQKKEDQVSVSEVQEEDKSSLILQDDPNISESEKIKKEILNSSKIFYALTHTIKEEVAQDPVTLQGGKLKNYQLQGLQWLLSLYNNNLNGILADEMGLGKTIQTIALLAYLMERKNNEGPFLIVVPLSTIANWILEFDRWAPHIKKMVYKGNGAARKSLGIQMRHGKFNVVLTTYEYIIKDKSVLTKIIWQYIIVDEGHRMKNSKCKFAMILGQNFQSAHRLLLTGTPLQNNLTELWALLNFLLPKIFASSEDFERWFNRPFAKMGVEKNILLNEEERLLIINRLHQVLRPFLLRRMKKEVEQELPNKVEYVIRVELSGWQMIFYDQLKKHGMLAIDPSTGKIGKRSLMNTLMQLRKICNHPYLFLANYDTDFLRENIWRCSGKFELLDRMLPKLVETGHKMLIFSQMTQLMNIMQIYLMQRNIPLLRLDGTTKVEERGQYTSLFNSEDSEYKIFLLSTRAGGQGLNLQAADTVILFDSDFNPQMDLQAQDRAHRIGQKREVRVYRLVTNTKVEEKIQTCANQKKSIDNAVIQAGLFNQKASDLDRRKKLEDLLKRDEKVQEEEEFAPDDEQINEYLARTEEELQKFQQMDRARYVEERKEEREKEVMEKLGLNELPKGFNYRLMQEYEVPDWVVSKEDNKEESKKDETEIEDPDQPLAMRTRWHGLKTRKILTEEDDDDDFESLSDDKRMIEIDTEEKAEDINDEEYEQESAKMEDIEEAKDNIEIKASNSKEITNGTNEGKEVEMKMNGANVNEEQKGYMNNQ